MQVDAVEENDVNATLAFWTRLRHNIVFTPSVVMPSIEDDGLMIKLKIYIKMLLLFGIIRIVRLSRLVSLGSKFL